MTIASRYFVSPQEQSPSRIATMSAPLDNRDSSSDTSAPDPQVLADHSLPGSRADASPPQLSLPEAASKLEQGLWCLIAQGLDDEQFWLAFSRLYRGLAGQLPQAERSRLAFHADYALARLGMPVWTVMTESTLLSSNDGSKPEPDGAPSVAAAA
ncbi:hypothetical protein [Luteimonas sp. R10]|uniref:hypothetical protein n=1 Tax=Luteimonas sp. R10 TaxID=3108176 RepID=UPI00308C5A90|nr:hypothetical protein U3649_13295 [Luteimonas sp. R10]